MSEPVNSAKPARRTRAKSTPPSVVDPSEIHVTARLRRIDPDYVAALADSMSTKGQLTPITLRPVDGADGQKYALVAGADIALRRSKSLGRKAVAHVVEMSDDEAHLAEIDENLIRHELRPIDRARSLAERKIIFERLFPDRIGQRAAGLARAKDSLGKLFPQLRTMTSAHVHLRRGNRRTYRALSTHHQPGRLYRAKHPRRSDGVAV